jgi:hypothetical protein
MLDSGQKQLIVCIRAVVYLGNETIHLFTVLFLYYRMLFDVSFQQEVIIVSKDEMRVTVSQANLREFFL